MVATLTSGAGRPNMAGALPGNGRLAWALRGISETESFADKPTKEIATYTASGTVSYALSDRLALTTGLGFGIADDDNPTGDMEFTNGDVSTALIATYATGGLSFFEQDAISFSLAAEYNISQREPSVSVDVLFRLELLTGRNAVLACALCNRDSIVWWWQARLMQGCKNIVGQLFVQRKQAHISVGTCGNVRAAFKQQF